LSDHLLDLLVPFDVTSSVLVEKSSPERLFRTSGRFLLSDGVEEGAIVDSAKVLLHYDTILGPDCEERESQYKSLAKIAKEREGRKLTEEVGSEPLEECADYQRSEPCQLHYEEEGRDGTYSILRDRECCGSLESSSILRQK